MTNNEHKAAPTVAGLESLTRYSVGGDGELQEMVAGRAYLVADVERWAASHAGASAVPAAWMHEDGRAVTAATMAGARKDGGAMLSSLRGYTIPLVRADLATPSTAAVRAAEWISVDDERKPEAKKPVLLYVRTLTRGEDDEGHPLDIEGAQVEMGEYRLNGGHPYFDCYAAPMSDSDWVTHWMELPAAPAAQAVEPAGQRAVGGLLTPEQMDRLDKIEAKAEAALAELAARTSAGQAAAGPVDDASALLEAAMKDAYDWIGEQMMAGREPEKAESDARIVKYIVARTVPPVAAAEPVASGWEIGYDEFTAPGTIRLHHQKWGGCFLPKPMPGDIRLPAMFYRLAADTIDAKLAAAAGDAEKDAARMDFIERCVMKDGQAFSARRDYDSFTNSPTYGYLPTVEVFTVPSQHVRGLGLRGAIDAAMASPVGAGDQGDA
jgi:hypothetical protein